MPSLQLNNKSDVLKNAKNFFHNFNQHANRRIIYQSCTKKCLKETKNHNCYKSDS